MSGKTDGKYALTATQKGVIGENLVANVLLRESDGRLSPFYSVADDDGIDLLVYDKETGVAIPIQVKSRTTTLKKTGSEQAGTGVHFEVRAAALREFQYAQLLAVLLDSSMANIQCAWLIPMELLSNVARITTDKLVIRPNSSKGSNDKFSPFRCPDAKDLVTRLLLLTTHLASKAAAISGAIVAADTSHPGGR